MSVGFDHPAVADYLARLEEAAAALPPDLRVELVADIRAHLAEGLDDTAASPDGGVGVEAAVRELLDRLGDPGDIVAEELRESGGIAPGAGIGPAAGRAGSTSDREPGRKAAEGMWGPLEVLAIILLTVGNVLILVGPVLGLALTWLSSRWTTRQKWIVTAAGSAVSVLLLLMWFSVTFVASTAEVDRTPADPLVSSVAPTVPGDTASATATPSVPVGTASASATPAG